MGLAATQARFLAVTSRKASCEFRSLQLAQQKLSLSREMQTATEEYQNALTATKLIWDADGTGDYRYNLSYSLMMNPSDLNKYTPYMVSRQDGKIALDEKMRKALSSVFNMTTDPTTGEISSDGGILYDGKVVYRGEANYEEAAGAAFIKFIEGLEENRGISGAVADKLREVKSDGVYYKYISNAGMGVPLSGKEKANQMTINSLLSYVDSVIENVASGYYAPGSKEEKWASLMIFDFDNGDKSCNLNTSWNSADGSTELLMNGNYLNDVTYEMVKEDGKIAKNKMKDADGNNMVGVSKFSTRAFTLSDLLNEDITLLVTGQQSYNQILENMEKAMKTTSAMGNSVLINDEVDVWYNQMAGEGAYERLVAEAKSNANSTAKSSLAILNFYDKLAKSMYKLFMPEKPTAQDDNAFFTALQNTISSLRNNIKSGTVQSWVDVGAIFPINSESSGKNAVVSADKYNCWVKNGNQWAISFSNLTEAFLTNFVNGMDNYGNGCLIAQRAAASTYITDDPSYLYTVNVIDEDSTSGLWESEFYSTIFNNVCSNGWYANEQVNDEEYLANALKNGQLFVVSQGNDNYFYQSRYSNVAGGHISQETDEVAVAKAEREYLYKKNKINYKEDQIEIESKNVEAELTSLTAELETVKNLVNKNIEKTFKMFQS